MSGPKSTSGIPGLQNWPPRLRFKVVSGFEKGSVGMSHRPGSQNDTLALCDLTLTRDRCDFAVH
jgi:hypothetical protein